MEATKIIPAPENDGVLCYVALKEKGSCEKFQETFKELKKVVCEIPVLVT